MTDIMSLQNNIEDEEAKAIAEVLKVNTWVTRMNLDNNNIGDEGRRKFSNVGLQILHCKTKWFGLHIHQKIFLRANIWSAVGASGCETYVAH